MPATTPIFALPYPVAADPPAGHTQMQSLATAVETVLARMDTTYTMRTYSANATWTKPTGIKGVLVRVIGGGGGSGGNALTAVGELSPSAGGGGGAYSEAWIPAASLGATVAVTVGAGGTAATAGNNAGGTGVTSSFGTLLSASGGVGGAGAGAGTSSAYSSPGGAGGATFGGSVAAANRMNYSGGDGQRGLRISGTVGLSGSGGAAGVGGGQQTGRTSGGLGAAGLVPGGGASGSFNGASSAVQAGVAGARGEVTVIEIY